MAISEETQTRNSRKRKDILDTAINSLFKDFAGDSSLYRSYCIQNAPRIIADAEFVAGQLNKSDRLLDVGAVPPLMVAILREYGFDQLSIVDPLPNTFNGFCNANDIDFHQIDLMNETPPSEFISKFDFVCLNEVVEHLAGNLVSAVKSVAACTRPGGRMLVTTPNLRSLSGLTALVCCNSGLASKPHDSIRAQYERKSAEWGYFGHLREFTTKELVDFIESFGFRLVARKMQPNYLNRGRLFGYVAKVEWLFPSYRLFGKYVFEKLPNEYDNVNAQQLMS